MLFWEAEKALKIKEKLHESYGFFKALETL
jgi:hypothetical protein